VASGRQFVLRVLFFGSGRAYLRTTGSPAHGGVTMIETNQCLQLINLVSLLFDLPLLVFDCIDEKHVQAFVFHTGDFTVAVTERE
jgi:hypothetical protein